MAAPAAAKAAAALSELPAPEADAVTFKTIAPPQWGETMFSVAGSCTVCSASSIVYWVDHGK
jgi:hypothetical protein